MTTEGAVSKPGLVYGRATGWGQNGPMSQMAGHDINDIALTGVLDRIGPSGAPTVPLNLQEDYAGVGLYGLLPVWVAQQSFGTARLPRADCSIRPAYRCVPETQTPG